MNAIHKCYCTKYWCDDRSRHVGHVKVTAWRMQYIQITLIHTIERSFLTVVNYLLKMSTYSVEYAMLDSQ